MGVIEPGAVCNLIVSPNDCDFCGNDQRKGTETCDDGNKVDGKGCTSDCLGVLSTWTCSGGGFGVVDTCNPICHDGIVISPEEACD